MGILIYVVYYLILIFLINIAILSQKQISIAKLVSHNIISKTRLNLKMSFIILATKNYKYLQYEKRIKLTNKQTRYINIYRSLLLCI